ncbi:hypothetical protein Desac_0911 [Desulfobacca acetoxidans DSM 11109]|uniref:Uncharacterized protein n=2 Tax=Desulfobacca acetoxidans TaxID=60893 RepID=F2NH11_DESAR|nr:hypothetical protein Desac_0911 [Desulfobacca acetoxidans DSM 11109]
MNFLSGTWVGTISGTNVGSFILNLEERDGQLSGLVHLTDFNNGLFIYDCVGQVYENQLDFEVKPRGFPELARVSPGKMTGTIQPDGSMTGSWSTEQGTAGTFLAFKQEIPAGQIVSAKISDAPAMVAFFEKQTHVQSCVVDIDILRRIHRELSSGSDEAARLELAQQAQLSTAPSAAKVPSQGLDYPNIRALYSVTIVAKGLYGEQIMSIDPAILDEGRLPKPLASVEFNIGNFYSWKRNMVAPNRATVRLDFTKPPIFDFPNPSILQTQNDSIIQVAGNDSIWVSGIYDKMKATLRHGRVKSSWLHSRYTYDILLIIIGLPAALAAASLIGELINGIVLKKLAGFIFTFLFSLSVFRIAFNTVRWLLPVIEFSGLPQPLHRQLRLGLSTIVLGVISSLGAALIWMVMTKG